MQGRFCLAVALSLIALLAGSTACLASVSVIHTFDGEAHPGGLRCPGCDIGDFNGDTYADWAIYTDEKSVNVYFGGACPDTIPDLVLREHYFPEGYNLRLAGECDFNGDGYDDIALVAGKRAYVYLGEATPDAEWDLQLDWIREESRAFLAAAGDFNGDGYGDLVVSDDSTAYVYLGGDPPDGNQDLTIARGMQVAGSGDVNDDGYDDIAAGTNPTNIYLGSATPDFSPDLAVSSTWCGDYPHAIGGAGDFNGDGFSDLAIGDPYYDNPATPSWYDGKITVYYGGSPMDAAPDWTILGTGGELGASVSRAGDVNGDDFDDFLVGCRSGAGHYLFYGAATPDTIPDLQLVGVTGDSNWGAVAVGLGDVNGDDVDDVLGGPGYDGNHARIYFGGAAMDSIADLVMTDEVGHQLGYVVSEAGDLNGDTYTDWAIGLPFALTNGKAYVYYGGATCDTIRDVTLAGSPGFGGQLHPAGDVKNDGYDDMLARDDGWGGYVYVYYGGSPMDSVHDKRLSESGAGDYGTAGMAKAGDFNGDGYDDVLVGISSFFGPGWTELYYGGATFNAKPDVYFTSYECAGGGNLNGDAFADILTGERYSWSDNGLVRVYLGAASADSAPDPAYLLEGPVETFGSRVAFAGDVNGDSFDDILVSCSSYEYEDGDVYLYFGGPAMDTLPDLTLTSPGTGSGFGSALEPLGDINGDSFDDIAVGAPWSADYKGEAYIYFGGASMDADADITLVGENPEDRFGFSIAGTGDINGDDQVEFLVGAPGYDDNRGVAYMYAASSAGVSAAKPDPGRLVISEIGPNPLTGRLMVKYSVDRPGVVQADLFDVSGKVVRRLARESALAGDHVLEIDLERNGQRPIAPGVYFIRLSQNGESQAKKIVIAQ